MGGPCIFILAKEHVDLLHHKTHECTILGVEKNATLRDTGLEISNRKETITASKAYLAQD